jgi:hypothetical protein
MLQAPATGEQTERDGWAFMLKGAELVWHVLV